MYCRDPYLWQHALLRGKYENTLDLTLNLKMFYSKSEQICLLRNVIFFSFLQYSMPTWQYFLMLFFFFFFSGEVSSFSTAEGKRLAKLVREISFIPGSLQPSASDGRLPRYLYRLLTHVWDCDSTEELRQWQAVALEMCEGVILHVLHPSCCQTQAFQLLTHSAQSSN